MKAHFHRVPSQLESSFSIRHDVLPNFGRLWHYHPELELHFTIRGEGVRIIGDNIGNFSAGELILLGENLPHTWHCKEEYFHEGSGREVEAIVVHFLPTCLGQDFLRLPEAHLLPRLFDKARGGMIILNEARRKVAALMTAATRASGFDRLIMLMRILKILAETRDSQPLTSSYTFYKSDDLETERLNKVCNYTLSNFQAPITLEEVAAMSNLTVTSFCRYFKLMTKKTYYDFLTEIRINHACRHLIENKRSIDLIASGCGFSNLSNFYRQFKKVTGMTPLTYRRVYLNLPDDTPQMIS